MGCIALVIDTLSGGGAEQVVLRLASALIDRGCQVKLIVINPKVSHNVPKQIETFFVNMPDTGKGWKLTYYKRTSVALQKILDKLNEQQHIDAVISNLPETDRICRYLQDYKVYYCIHNSFYHGQIENKKGFLKRYLKKKKLQHIYANKHLICVSRGAEDDLLKRVGVKPASSRVIYNPFPIEEIRRLSQASENVPQHYFLHVGRFNRQKRHDRLLRIYAESGLTNPLLLMGEGSPDQIVEIKRLIVSYGLEEKVELTGFKQNPFSYIRHATALLLTSDYEGLPTVVIEALICGTPVVAFDCPSGLDEILTGELTKYLIPRNDVDSFINKMKALARNSERIAADGLGLERFKASSIADQYISTVLPNRTDN